MLELRNTDTEWSVGALLTNTHSHRAPTFRFGLSSIGLTLLQWSPGKFAVASEKFVVERLRRSVELAADDERACIDVSAYMYAHVMAR